MLGQLRGWEWLIIVALVLLLFGAKRLPDAARGMGRSLRIFKAETKGLVDEGKDAAQSAPPAVQAPPAPQAVQAAEASTPPPAAQPERAES